MNLFKKNLQFIIYAILYKSMENVIYRVYDKKDRYHQSYSPKLNDAKNWAIDCASSIKGYVKEDSIDDNGNMTNSKVIFSTKTPEKKT